ncbi:hypothetical protein QR685DRAFT_593825 [Neurospora intermedia]|uniref:Uncharacterized protein n=1 Tax=Neurospora intermedia TaxID=5142 RepID=A0ABR3DR97_NEUIN
MSVSSPGTIVDESYDDLSWVDFRLDRADDITAIKKSLTNQAWFEPLSHPEKDMSGFNVAMIVMRMIYGNVLATPATAKPSLESLEDDEDWESEPETDGMSEHLHLRSFLYDNEKAKKAKNNRTESVSSSAAYDRTVFEMAELLLSSFPKHRHEDGPISFSYIMSSDLANDALWSHPSFLYYSPIVGCAPAEAGPWTVGRKKIPTRMNAHYSLLHFDWALERKQFAGLGAFLTSVVLPRQRPDGQWLLYQPNFPKALRVRYVPAADTRRSFSPDGGASPYDQNPGFDDLRHITIGGRKIDTSTSLVEWARKDKQGQATRQGYSIFAVVRLRNSSNPKEQDLVQTYDVQQIADMERRADGIVVPEMSTTSRTGSATRYLTDGWKLGEPGHEYDLFYCRDEAEPEGDARASGAKAGSAKEVGGGGDEEKQEQREKRANDIPYESIEDGDATLQWEGAK